MAAERLSLVCEMRCLAQRHRSLGPLHGSHLLSPLPVADSEPCAFSYIGTDELKHTFSKQRSSVRERGEGLCLPDSGLVVWTSKFSFCLGVMWDAAHQTFSIEPSGPCGFHVMYGASAPSIFCCNSYLISLQLRLYVVCLSTEALISICFYQRYLSPDSGYKSCFT